MKFSVETVLLGVESENSQELSLDELAMVGGGYNGSGSQNYDPVPEPRPGDRMPGYDPRNIPRPWMIQYFIEVYLFVIRTSVSAQSAV